MPRPRSIPTYRLHKPSGQAVVTVGGRDVYLGPHGSPESRARYEQVVAEWLARGRTSPLPPAGPELTVAQGLAAYWEYAEPYYGSKTAQAERIKVVIGIVRSLYGAAPIAGFGPAALKATRQKMIERGWCRRYINHCIGCAKRMWKWLAGEELIPASAWHALQAVEGLRAGRSPARESAPVKPVPEQHIDPVRGQVLPQVRAMIDLQLLTAMRPGEVVQLRPCDVDRSGDVWTYRPARHKTAYRGHERSIFIGPRAQQILAPWLLRAADAYCFSPKEAIAARAAELGESTRRGKKRMPGHCYRRDSYAHAIAKGCERAQVTHWHPHQLRHNAATRLVAEFGYEVARIILGHRSLAVTEVYAERDIAKAIEAMRKVG